MRTRNCLQLFGLSVLTPLAVQIRRLGFLRSLVAFAFIVALTSPWCAAQNKPAADSADVEWMALTKPVAAARKTLAPVVATKSGIADEAKPRSEAARLKEKDLQKEKDIEPLVQRADQYRQFRLKHPQHPKAKEAKCEEAVALLQAGFRGDAAQEVQRGQLVAEIRADKSISAAQRSRVTAYAENLKIMRRKEMPAADRLNEYERVARALVAEFPEVAEGYESLFGIACSRSDEAGLKVAKELQGTAAPEAVKHQARLLIERHSLIGKPVAALTAALPELRARLEQEREKGRAIILYTWSMRNPSSLALAKRLGGEASRQAAHIGLNLDNDVVAAKACATEASVQGEQYYEAQPVAGVLTMQAPGLVFVIDKKGVITSVSAHRNLETVLKEFATP